MDQRADHNVVPSQAMIVPMQSDAFARRDYPVLPTPEPVHARLWGDPGTHVYHLNYCGHDIVTLRVKSEGNVRVRCYSDGNFLSMPFTQQLLVQSTEDAEVEVEFSLPCDMISMRPRRAEYGEAILTQTGRPLIRGVNGLYALDWDLLISWHGYPFDWHEAMITEKNGVRTASFSSRAGIRPFMLMLRPRYYGQHLNFRGFTPWKGRVNDKAVAGWCSWEAYHSDICQADVEETAAFLQILRRYGLEYMQIDDGFEMPLLPHDPNGSITDAWLNTNEKFPGGHEAIVGAIRAKGFEPGLWVAPNITNGLTARNCNFSIKHKSGEPLFGDWIRGVIDCLPETLEKQVVPCYRALRRAGYSYIKIDGFRHLMYDGFHEAVRYGLMDADEAFDRVKRYSEAAREGLGKDVYLMGCWGVITPTVGSVDAMRVSTDANPSWAAFSMQLYDTARWFFAQRVLFTIDPDHICVRAQYEWSRMLLSLVSLTGGLYMISDKPDNYDDSRLELIRKTLPTLKTYTAETGPLDLTIPTCARGFQGVDADLLSRAITYIDEGDSPFSSLWANHIEHNGRIWCVAQRAAIVALPHLDVPLEKLGLDPAGAYFGFNFWAQKPLGVISGSLRFAELALGDTEVVALHDIGDGAPRLIGSDRHISMDAVSVETAEWDAAIGRFSMRLIGWAGLAVKYCVYPAGLPLAVVGAEGADVAMVREDLVVWVDVVFEDDRAIVVLGAEEAEK